LVLPLLLCPTKKCVSKFRIDVSLAINEDPSLIDASWNAAATSYYTDCVGFGNFFYYVCNKINKLAEKVMMYDPSNLWFTCSNRQASQAI
jgi:hypothetical protein